MCGKVREFRFGGGSTETNNSSERPHLLNKDDRRMSQKSAPRRSKRDPRRVKVKVLGSERPAMREQGSQPMRCLKKARRESVWRTV